MNPRTLAASHWLPAALVGLFLLLGAHHTLKVLQPVKRDDGENTRSAILRWMPQLRALRDGQDPYTLYNYPNPPIMALLLLPLTALPPVATALVWFYLKAAMALAVLAMTFRLVETPGRPFPAWAKAIAALLVLRLIIGDLQHGNVNIWILFLVVLTLSFLRSGRDVFAGLALALAIACKVTPALLLPYLVWKRAWWSLGASALGLVFFLVTLPGFAFGQERNLELLGGWYRVMVKPFAVEGKVTPEHQNQSVPGLVARLGTAAPAFSNYLPDENGVEVYTPQEYHNLVDLGPRGASLLTKGLLVAFGLVVLWACRAPFHPTDARRDWRLAAEYGLILVGMLLFSERTWKHHAVTLVVPAAVLCYAWSALPMSAVGRRVLTAGLVVWACIVLLTSENVLGKHGADLALTYGVFTGLFALAGAGMVFVLRAVPAAETQAATVDHSADLPYRSRAA